MRGRRRRTLRLRNQLSREPRYAHALSLLCTYATSSSRLLKYLILSRSSAARSNSYLAAAARICPSSFCIVPAMSSTEYSSASSATLAFDLHPSGAIVALLPPPDFAFVQGGI